MTSTVKVKAGSSTITRRFEIDSKCSWDELKLQVSKIALCCFFQAYQIQKRCYPIEASLTKFLESFFIQIRRLFDLQDNFSLKYIDDEDELVSIQPPGCYLSFQACMLVYSCVTISGICSRLTWLQCFKDSLQGQFLYNFIIKRVCISIPSALS